MIKSLKEFFERNEQGADSGALGAGNRVELAAAVLMLEISLADSSLDDEELVIIKNALVNVFHIEAQQVSELIDLAQKEVDLSVSLHDFTRLLNEKLSMEERTQVVELLWQVAFADAVLNKYEEYYIRKIAGLLYIPHKDYLKTKHKVIAEQEQA